MRVTIRHKDFEITPAFQTYIDTKLIQQMERLLKHYAAEELSILDLEFGRSTQHHYKGNVFFASATITIGKEVIRATEEAEDIHIACDKIRDEIERQFIDLKGKKAATDRRTARKAKKEIRLDPAARMYRKGRIRDEGN